jgi:hypothetical protein
MESGEGVMTPAEKAFRQLRADWFVQHLEEHPHEREWEDETHTDLRERRNVELRAKFDQQTDGILSGEEYPIAPRCANDLYTREESEDVPSDSSA